MSEKIVLLKDSLGNKLYPNISTSITTSTLDLTPGNILQLYTLRAVSSTPQRIGYDSWWTTGYVPIRPSYYDVIRRVGPNIPDDVEDGYLSIRNTSTTPWYVLIEAGIGVINPVYNQYETDALCRFDYQLRYVADNIPDSLLTRASTAIYNSVPGTGEQGRGTMQMSEVLIIDPGTTYHFRMETQTVQAGYVAYINDIWYKATFVGEVEESS